MEFLTSAPIMTEYADFSRLFHTRLDINPFEGEPLMEAFAKTQRITCASRDFPSTTGACSCPRWKAALIGQKSAEDALMTTAELVNERIRGE